MSKVYLDRFLDQSLNPNVMLQALNWLSWEDIVQKDARVFIKPNLTWPNHLPGVTTTPNAMESLVSVLKARTDRITIGESDGGYHSYDVEEAFEGHGLYTLQKKYGFKLVNLSDIPAERTSQEIAGREVTVTLPSLLLHEIDVFITIPVPKTHVMTRVSLAFKNQWGCIPSPMRLREHADFDHKIILINRLLNPKLAILDWTYFLDGAGPMTGEAVKMDLLIAGDGPGAASAVACGLMGIDPKSVRHFRVAEKEKMFPESLDEITINNPIEPFIVRQFVMRRAFLDWISL